MDLRQIYRIWTLTTLSKFTFGSRKTICSSIFTNFWPVPNYSRTTLLQVICLTYNKMHVLTRSCKTLVLEKSRKSILRDLQSPCKIFQGRAIECCKQSKRLRIFWKSQDKERFNLDLFCHTLIFVNLASNLKKGEFLN